MQTTGICIEGEVDQLKNKSQPPTNRVGIEGRGFIKKPASVQTTGISIEGEVANLKIKPYPHPQGVLECSLTHRVCWSVDSRVCIELEGRGLT